MKVILVLLLLLWAFYEMFFLVNPREYEDRTYMGRQNRYTNGSYIFFEEVSDAGKYDILVADSTLYQIIEKDSSYNSIVYLESTPYYYYYEDNIDPTSAERLLAWVHEGGTALLVGEYGRFSTLIDTLSISLDYNYEYEGESFPIVDWAYNRQMWPEIESGVEYRDYNPTIVKNYDTTTTSVLWVIDSMRPVMTVTEFGKGKILYTPLFDVFSNLSLIKSDGYLLDGIMSYLEPGKMLWLELKKEEEGKSKYQHLMEDPSLSWAYYIGVFSLVLFLISNSRRRQRAIPELIPKTNDTLLLATNISKVYRDEEGYKNLAIKRLAHWQLHVKRRYGIEIGVSEFSILKLSKKSGVSESLLSSIVAWQKLNGNKDGVTRKDFIELSKKLDEFYRISE